MDDFICIRSGDVAMFFILMETWFSLNYHPTFWADRAEIGTKWCITILLATTKHLNIFFFDEELTTIIIYTADRMEQEDNIFNWNCFEENAHLNRVDRVWMIIMTSDGNTFDHYRIYTMHIRELFQQSRSLVVGHFHPRDIWSSFQVDAI